MERWRVDELFRLADAIAAAGLHSFAVRRTLQRLERGDVDPIQAAVRIAEVVSVDGSILSHQCEPLNQDSSDRIPGSCGL